MKLQLALDRLTKEECFQIVEKTKSAIDIIEVGTGVIKEYGMTIVRDIREWFPKKLILADMKTCDAGRYEVKQAFDAGADITTVMAFSSDATIRDTITVAKAECKQVMIDLLGVSSRERVARLKELGVDLVSLHVGKDHQRTMNFNIDLFSLIKGYDFAVAVAGGVNANSLPSIVQAQPDIIIVGSAITKTKNPKQAAFELKQMM